MSTGHYVFAGGGTGGHLYPGLAVAAALRQRDPQARITFLTTTRPLDRQLLEPTDYAQIEQPVQPFTMHPLRLPGFLLTWQRSVAAAREFLRKQSVRAVLGLGGYAAGPPVVAARKLGLPTAILNPDAIPGRANQYLARRAALVVLQWEVSRRHFSPETACAALGCPIRSAFGTATRDEGCRRFNLDIARPVLVVTGASQGARTVNEAVTRVWPEFLSRHPAWQLLHLSGPADEPAVRAAYAAAKAPATVMAFTHEMHLALAAADLVVSRAGASTLAELTALGRASILLPYPYARDRHQHANAQVLVDEGAAIMLEDHRDAGRNAPALAEALVILADDAARTSMAQVARCLGRPEAAGGVADWLISGAKLGPLPASAVSAG